MLRCYWFLVCLNILLLVLSCPRSFSTQVYSDRKCLVRHGIFINLVICWGLSFCRYRAVMSMSLNGDVLLSLVRVRRVILRRLVGSLIVGVTMMKHYHCWVAQSFVIRSRGKAWDSQMACQSKSSTMSDWLVCQSCLGHNDILNDCQLIMMLSMIIVGYCDDLLDLQNVSYISFLLIFLKHFSSFLFLFFIS